MRDRRAGRKRCAGSPRRARPPRSCRCGRSRCRRSRPRRPSPGSVRNGSSRQVTIVPRKAMLSGVSLMPASHLVARANPDRVWRRTADTSAVAMDARGAQPYRTGMVRFRRFAALVAAYAIALQALFAAFALPSHVARAGAASICLSSEDGGTPSPQSGHDPCAMCLAGQCSHLLGAVPHAQTPIGRVIVAIEIEPLRLRPVIAIPATHQQPNSPRAPPAA